MSRKQPYTERGISRVPCLRCGAPSTQQWRICAIGEWDGLCTKCDVQLNSLVLMFVKHPDRTRLSADYAVKMGVAR